VKFKIIVLYFLLIGCLNSNKGLFVMLGGDMIIIIEKKEKKVSLLKEGVVEEITWSAKQVGFKGSIL